MRPKHPQRIPFMLLGLVALIAAGWSGLIRMGWELPVLRPTLPMAHGPLMVSGFLGTVISLERAVALRDRWTYAAPLLSGLGGLILVVGISGQIGPLVITLGSLGMIAIFVAIVRRQTALFTLTMALGAVAWFAGNALWLSGRPVYTVVPWWAGFLILTIVGERLELSRLMQISRPVTLAYAASVALFGVGLLVTLVELRIGMQLAGAGMLAMTIWLLRYDVTRRTIRQQGMVRFIAACLVLGYLWLAIGGALFVAYGGNTAGPLYDAPLHAVFLGFVFSMIFGHALIILPAVVGIAVPYRSVFYLHLGLLHASLLLRVIGDLAGWMTVRQWGGMLNAVALLLFLGSTVYAVRQASEPAASPMRK